MSLTKEERKVLLTMMVEGSRDLFLAQAIPGLVDGIKQLVEDKKLSKEDSMKYVGAVNSTEGKNILIQSYMEVLDNMMNDWEIKFVEENNGYFADMYQLRLGTFGEMALIHCRNKIRHVAGLPELPPIHRA